MYRSLIFNLLALMIQIQKTWWLFKPNWEYLHKTVGINIEVAVRRIFIYERFLLLNIQDLENMRLRIFVPLFTRVFIQKGKSSISTYSVSVTPWNFHQIFPYTLSKEKKIYPFNLINSNETNELVKKKKKMMQKKCQEFNKQKSPYV